MVNVNNLTVEYRLPGRGGLLRAVDGVSFGIERGQTVGLVGESGSGKSTIGNAILGLADPADGRIEFDGADITHCPRADRRLLARRIQVIFQDPFGSMNPSLTVGETVAEALRYNLGLPKAQIRERVTQALADVGLPLDAAERYPTEFSGGQRQRIAIARALIMDPDFVICDEAVSALDLSVQAQVLNLLVKLRQERGLAYLFITHDLAVVRYISDQIVVLYAGQVMERGPVDLVADRPVHPYTQALTEAAPVPDPELQAARQAARTKVAPSAGSTGQTGCPFAARCPGAIGRCHTERPALVPYQGVLAACHLLTPDSKETIP
ncbi:MAG: ABC transporter ATP-binding protein [Bifidobacteriaceae bacterium]|nr:ABC transporter ATP-binding protein [Bifidobacteriaceae bacterium]